MRIRLRDFEPSTRRRTDVFDANVSRPGERDGELAPLVLKETSVLSLFVYPDASHSLADLEIRLRVGNVIVASSISHDRPDFTFDVPITDSRDEDYLVCSPPRGQYLLQDWVGQTEMTVESFSDNQWHSVLTVELHVAPGKMEIDDFNALCDDISNKSGSLLLDVYGKTFVGLESERQLGESAPVIVLKRLHTAIDQLKQIIRFIRHRPSYRLKTRRVREPAFSQQAVSEIMLEEACLDPSLIQRHSGKLQFCETIREEGCIDYELAENKAIAAFFEFLKIQSSDLRQRLTGEIALRVRRRPSRDVRPTGGGKSWWEKEDLPRIIELERLLEQLTDIEQGIAGLQRSWLVSSAAPLTNIPAVTPLVRTHRGYNQAYAIIRSHFRSFQFQLDDSHLLGRAKSLPVLYEWWCLLEVMRSLSSCLTISEAENTTADSPFRRLVSDGRDRFVIEFEGNQLVDFVDRNGRLVRLRYEPHYRRINDSGGLGYGLLGDGRLRTPDIAVEIFPESDSLAEPELIVILDAKYSTVSHERKLQELRAKYSQIGRFATGHILSRQIWAMTPAAASHGVTRTPEWSSFCTADNNAFWSDGFDVRSVVAGALQVKPMMPGGKSPLESLLELVLTRSGLQLAN